MDTITQECNKCGCETDCIEGICLECRLKMDKKWAIPIEEWNKLVERKLRLQKALDYAKFFIDGYGEARIKENLGRDGMDAVLEEIERIVEPINICPICLDEKPADDLHRNCGK